MKPRAEILKAVKSQSHCPLISPNSDMPSLGMGVEGKPQLRSGSFCNLFNDKGADQHVLPQRVKPNESGILTRFGKGGDGGAVKRHFVLFSSLCKILPAQRRKWPLYDQMGLQGPAWLLHGPSSAEQAEAALAPRGAAWLSGWTLGQPLSSWIQALLEASRKCGKEWERKGKVAAAVLRSSGSQGAFCPCWPWRTARWDSWEEAARGFHKFPKALGSFTQAQEFKWS